MITGSKSVQRARQTGEALAEGINETDVIEIINKEGKEGSKLSEFGVYAMSDLDPFKDAGKILAPINAEAQKLVDEKKIKTRGKGRLGDR